jgi:hypothetical protein
MTALLMTALLLSPAQAGSLKMTNVRNTYGFLGGTRPESKLIPGDVLFVGYDIEGLTCEPDGRTQYLMAMEVVNKDGKEFFSQKPEKKIEFNPLGGTKMPSRAIVTLGYDMPEGAYTMRVFVTDIATGNKGTLEKKFEVGKPDFGIVGVYASVDEEGKHHAATTSVLGQSVFINFAIVNFERDKDEKKKDPVAGFQPNVTVEMVPLDETGKPTIAKPTPFNQNAESQLKVGPMDGYISVHFYLPMTRSGKFTVRLKATDNLSKKTSTFDLPIVVMP